MLNVAVFPQLAQYIGIKLTQPGSGNILCQVQIDHTRSCSLPRWLSLWFEEAEATQCEPSVNCSLTAPRYRRFLFHIKYIAASRHNVRQI